MLSVRDLVADDHDWKVSTLRAGWGSTEVARLGELVDATELPGYVAEHDGERTGLATFAERADGIEVVTIQALIEGIGVGRALMDRLRIYASTSGAERLWLTTTNDNMRAFAFYQRWGMDLVRLVHGGVDVSRRAKPSIPLSGQDGVPLRHELEFELRIR
ncbi:MAG: GNAT family N-acetyltransferase [Acidimicrobiales bacterium]